MPQWDFARANSNDPCRPEAAFDGNGRPADGGNVQNWPDSDGDCAPNGAPFPTYCTVQEHNADDIRVAGTIHQATGGFRPAGNRHDFEETAASWGSADGNPGRVARESCSP